MTALYPLRFKEILRNYGFGGRWIVSEFAKEDLPDDHRVAETWEVCDRPGESSQVVNGPLYGQTLHELIDTYGEAFLGRDVVTRFGTRFPLLIKFLDASNPLGEQVHQSDEIAAKYGLSDPGKTEAWYMLRAKPGATIHCGETPEATPERVRAALGDGSIRELMAEYAVQPGDAFLLYAGAMHYSAGGVIFYEIMQNSDVVIGLRGPRSGQPVDLSEYVDRSMESIHLEPGSDYKTTPVAVADGNNERTWLFACQEFCLERLDLAGVYTLNCDGERFYVLSLIEGAADVVCGEFKVRLRPGYTCLLPASLGKVEIRPDGGDAALLKAYVPDLAANVVEPLRAAGISDPRILELGGRTALNPLSSLL